MKKTGIIVDLGRRPYGETWDLQRDLQDRRIRGEIPDCLLLVEHPPTFTIGRGGGDGHLLATERELAARGFEVVRTDRGGDITYHGPGQLVGYPILDLHEHGRDLHRYLRDLEDCLIRCLARFRVRGGRRPGLTGVWVGDRKIASIGVRVVRWVTMHGFALNVSTDLEPFRSIVPCGIRGCRMTSLEEILGSRVDLDDAAGRFADAFADRFHLSLLRTEPGILSGLPFPEPRPPAGGVGSGEVRSFAGRRRIHGNP